MAAVDTAAVLLDTAAAASAIFPNARAEALEAHTTCLEAVFPALLASAANIAKLRRTLDSTPRCCRLSRVESCGLPALTSSESPEGRSQKSAVRVPTLWGDCQYQALGVPTPHLCRPLEAWRPLEVRQRARKRRGVPQPRPQDPRRGPRPHNPVHRQAQRLHCQTAPLQGRPLEGYCQGGAYQQSEE